MNNLAPIGLTVYSRIDHLKQTVAALRHNTLAGDSKLYVFSDGPRPGDEKNVQEVRNFLRTIDGFRDVEIIERKENSRIRNNRGGQKYLLAKYGKMIWMAEDIVTAPGFLQFMNDALTFYKNHPQVVSVTGYTPPIHIPKEYLYDSFFIKRFNAWGLGFWEEKFKPFEERIDKSEYLKNIRNKDFLNDLKASGDDIPGMLKLEVEQKIDAIDVRIIYHQTRNNWVTVYPRKSLVQNIGHDGSGVHCWKTTKYLHDSLWDKTDNFNMARQVVIHKEIVKEYYRINKRNQHK